MGVVGANTKIDKHPKDAILITLAIPNIQNLDIKEGQGMYIALFRVLSRLDKLF
jgi:hypothetical protein